MQAREITDEDSLHIRIHCRCGEESIEEIPVALASATNVHFCPKCKSAFTIRKVDEEWKIARVA